MARKNEYDISEILKECRRSASNGYKIASEHASRLNETLLEAEKKIGDTVSDFSSSPLYDSGATELLERQLLEIRSSFNNLALSLNYDLRLLHRNQSQFTISLFGRTMTGKSTLMETLTHGNGKTIGTGSQRTTRDVRTYRWNSLLIKDVPGIAAFEGQDDESKAFEAAKSADLILFLITDDGVQAAEAECFRRIVNLGKPIICIMNVKVSVDEEDAETSLWDIEDSFDFSRLNEIKDEFFSYGDSEWRRIPFVYVHLQSAFFAQQIKDEELRKKFHRISRIDFLKEKIINQICEKGKFLRTKTFIDFISAPIIESEEILLRQSILNSAQGRTLLAKRRKLAEWKERFVQSGNRQIDSLVSETRSQLYSEIAAFAEDHFEDRNADKAWNKLLKNLGIANKYTELLKKLENQTNDHITEISREIANELEFTSIITEDRELRMRPIVDGRKLWNWGSLMLGGGLSVGAGISYLIGASLTGPLGWAAIAVSAIGALGAWLSKSREKKEYEARRKLEKSLKKNVDSVCKSLKSQMSKNFEKLIQERVTKLVYEMDRMNAAIFKLSDTQKELAWDLNQHLLDLNKQIITEAIRFIGAEELDVKISKVARIPGNVILIQLKDGERFPDNAKLELHDLLSEFITFVYQSEDIRILISKILRRGIERTNIRVEDKIGVAHIHIEDTDSIIINRVRLAQQLSGLIITE